MALLGGVKLTDAQVLSWTRPAWARTIASIQGTEFDEELRVWDTRNPHFTMKHLYVCLSRAKGALGKHSCEIVIAFTTQEEVGLRGAQVAANQVNADVGIGLDVTLGCDTPGVPTTQRVTKRGDGAALVVQHLIL